MPMKELLNSDCGQLNPVLRVASHFTGSGSSGGDGSTTHMLGRSAQDPSIIFDDASSHPGRVAGPALLPPTTFRMDSLLKEIQSLDRSHGLAEAPRVVDLTNNEEWVQEFRSSDAAVSSGVNHEWVDEFRTGAILDLDRVWDESKPSFRTSLLPVHPVPHEGYHRDPTLGNAKELLDDSKWVGEFDQESKTELMSTAENFINSMSDPSIKATEFMSFVEKLSTGEATLADHSQEPAERWTSEYEARAIPADEIWAHEFATGNMDVDSDKMNPTERMEFWQKLQTEWDRAAGETGLHPWLSESDSLQQFEQPYRFENENPYADHDDPLEEGKRKLMASDIPAAALLFETAVQKQPNNPEAWYLLGTTQALNEQDPQAISALSKCIEFEPNNLKALMAVAASLTNESFHLQACRILKTWLKQNPKYADLVPGEIEKLSITSSILPSNELATVQNLYIRAARKNPAHDLDADVQCGLGVLFNLASDYDKAADCFQAAVNADPNNALMWNRLGATLANGGKSAEAIGAYSKALEIIPGFIRTRYNLGIACVNLGAYKEAAEHFLSALNMQAAGKSALTGPNGKNNMSDSIWTSLRMVLHLLDKGKLSSAIDQRDLDVLNREFGVS